LGVVLDAESRGDDDRVLALVFGHLQALEEVGLPWVALLGGDSPLAKRLVTDAVGASCDAGLRAD
jgi:hypothetical protein